MSAEDVRRRGTERNRKERRRENYTDLLEYAVVGILEVCNDARI